MDEYTKIDDFTQNILQFYHGKVKCFQS